MAESGASLVGTLGMLGCGRLATTATATAARILCLYTA